MHKCWLNFGSNAIPFRTLAHASFSGKPFVGKGYTPCDTKQDGSTDNALAATVKSVPLKMQMARPHYAAGPFSNSLVVSLKR